MSEYDDIIVGGGSAGIALATRLTEDAGRQVLLIEAGPDDPGITDADRLTDQMEFQATLTDWGIDASFVPGGTTLNYPQGRKTGGGSAVNGAFAVRGVRDDYDALGRRGGRRLVVAAHAARPVPPRIRPGLRGEYHGTDGPVPVVRWRRDELLPQQEASSPRSWTMGSPGSTISTRRTPRASGRCP